MGLRRRPVEYASRRHRPGVVGWREHLDAGWRRAGRNSARHGAAPAGAGQSRNPADRRFRSERARPRRYERELLASRCAPARQGPRSDLRLSLEHREPVGRRQGERDPSGQHGFAAIAADAAHLRWRRADNHALDRSFQCAQAGRHARCDCKQRARARRPCRRLRSFVGLLRLFLPDSLEVRVLDRRLADDGPDRRQQSDAQRIRRGLAARRIAKAHAPA